MDLVVNTTKVYKIRTTWGPLPLRKFRCPNTRIVMALWSNKSVKQTRIYLFVLKDIRPVYNKHALYIRTEIMLKTRLKST